MIEKLTLAASGAGFGAALVAGSFTRFPRLRLVNWWFALVNLAFVMYWVWWR
jgi:hypothetical protein